MNKDEQWLLKEKYNGEKSTAFFADCERLRAGEPLAYVIGFVPFLNSMMWLDSKPLIPRPETEFWVEKALEYIGKTYVHGVRVLDLCAGSGAIGVAVATAVPNAQVTIAELDPIHLPTIEKNCIENGLVEYTIIESNLFENVAGTFDLILSNPPYIDPALDRAEHSVKAHEPHLALYGGRGGTELIERIVADAPAHLHQHGQLWLEHEPEQVSFIHELAARAGLTATTHNDQYEVPRYTILAVA